MVKAASEANAIVYIDHIRRWAAPLEGLKRLINSNVIGEVKRMHYNFGRSGFAMIGTHLFDLSRWLFESEIEKVRGELDTTIRPSWRGEQYVDQSGKCEYYLKNGIHITLDLSDDLPLQQDNFTIYGSLGRIDVDQRVGNIRLFGNSGQMLDDNFPWKASFENSLCNALFELEKGEKPRCSAEDGLIALEATLAVHDSSRNNGVWKSLPLDGSIVEENFPFA